MFGAALVVDDEENVCKLLRHLLQRHCDTIDVARDGLDAIERLQSRPYELVFLDIILPKRNGFQVAHAIQGLPRRPKLVVLSAVAKEFEDRFPAGTVLLQKPFDIDRFRALVQDGST